MGYNPGVKTYKLVFVDRDELIVKVISLPIGEFLKVARLADTAKKLSDATAMSGLRELLEMFASRLVYWNVELPVDPKDPDSPVEPVPTTVEGVLRLDLDLVLEIIFSWVEAIAGVADPLGHPSDSGGNAPEGLIPMETLSESPTS